MTEIQLNPGNWQDFSCFLPGAALDGKEETHFLWQYGNNTEGLVGEANDYAIRERLAPYGEDAEFDDIPSGLRGVKIHSVLVRVVDENGEATEVAREVSALIEELENHIVLDHEKLSELEYEAWRDNVHFELRYIEMPEDADEVLDNVLDELAEMGVDESQYPFKEDILKACENLGYLDTPAERRQDDLRFALIALGLPIASVYDLTERLTEWLGERELPEFIDFGIVAEWCQTLGATVAG